MSKLTPYEDGSMRGASKKVITNEAVDALRPTHHELAVAAYFVWQDSGMGDGHDLDDWYEAERKLHQAARDRL